MCGHCEYVSNIGPDELEQHLVRDSAPEILEATGYLRTVPQDYHVISANSCAGLEREASLDDHESYVEIEFPGPTHKLLSNGPRPGPGETVVLQIYLQSGLKTAVIQRDTDLLTPEEVRQHHDEVMAAMLKELQTWAKYKCFSRRPRAGAKNIIDCRWVLKWKHEVVDGKQRRVIRARLTVRGFKDRQAADLDSYAGTAQRYSQRTVVSVAVQQGWDIVTADVEKAFLQGVTYEELAQMTGEAPREVNFYLPPGSVPMLRRVPGFENFDPHTEVCHCDKPGTGLVDAPRAFSMKLATVTKDKCGLLPCSVDGELCLKHVDGKLVGMLAKHVDDLKIVGKPDFIHYVKDELEKVFGPLKLIWNEFTNCGVRHIQDPTTKECTLDQIEYVAALKPITHPLLSQASSDALASDELQNLYRSLLGAVAFAALTRVDAAVFIVALQRMSGKAKNIHIKRLNTLTKWMQRCPTKLLYKRFKEAVSHLQAISDAAFRKEDDDAHALKGALFLRVSGSPDTNSGRVAHLIDYYCRKQRHVTRSTFGAELYAACDAADHSMLLAQILHEVGNCACTATMARQLRETGGWTTVIVLGIDAMSVFAGTTATVLKIPAEKGLWSHVQYLRELLDVGVLSALWWIDTRDMHSDGLTKGSVDRRAIHDIMSGNIRYVHETKSWKPRIVGGSSEPPPLAIEGENLVIRL